MKRILIIEWVIAILFVLSLAIYILNQEFFHLSSLDDIIGYIIVFSAGAYSGFQWYKYEVHRLWKKERTDN